MTNSKLFKQAHVMTKQVIKSGDCYRVTFGLCLKQIKADNKKSGFLSIIYLVALAVIFNILASNNKPAKRVAMPSQKGVIVYANKGNDKTAFEVTTICNGGFVAKNLYSRSITIFKIVNDELTSNCGYVYNELASEAWLNMYNSEQARISA